MVPEIMAAQPAPPTPLAIRPGADPTPGGQNRDARSDYSTLAPASLIFLGSFFTIFPCFSGWVSRNAGLRLLGLEFSAHLGRFGAGMGGIWA